MSLFCYSQSTVTKMSLERYHIFCLSSTFWTPLKDLRNLFLHWSYFLKSEARKLFLQPPWNQGSTAWLGSTNQTSCSGLSFGSASFEEGTWRIHSLKTMEGSISLSEDSRAVTCVSDIVIFSLKQPGCILDSIPSYILNYRISLSKFCFCSN